MPPVPLKKLKYVLEQAQAAQQIGMAPEQIEAYVKQHTGLTLPELQSAIEQRSPIRVQDIGRGIAQGATLGFSDELLGLGAALVPGGKGYRDARDAERARMAQFRADHPRAALLSEIGGAVLVPGLGSVGAARGATTAGAAALRAAAVGGAEGLLSGIGYGDTPEEMSRGSVVGTLMGIPLGALGGYAGARIAQREATPAGRAIREAIEETGGMKPIEANAARMAEAGRGDVMVPADWSPRLGGGYQSLLDQAMTQNPNVAAQVGERMGARSEDAAQRMIQDVSEYLGGRPNIPKQAERLESARRVAGEAFDAIREANPLIDDPKLTEFLSRPVAKSMFEDAKRLGVLAGEEELEPNARHAIAVLRRLRGRRGAAQRAGDTDAMEMYGNAMRELRDILGEALPDFGKANANYAAAKRAIEAAELGVDWAKRQDVDGLRQLVSTLDASELREFREALAGGLVRDLSNLATNRDAAARFATASEGLQGTLEVVFGSKSRASKFLDAAWAERSMRRTAQSGVSGPQTAARLVDYLQGGGLPQRGRWLDRAMGWAEDKLMSGRRKARMAEMSQEIGDLLTNPSSFDEFRRAIERRSQRGAGMLPLFSAAAYPTIQQPGGLLDSLQ